MMCIQKQSFGEGTPSSSWPTQSEFMPLVPTMHSLSFSKDPSLNNELGGHHNPILATKLRDVEKCICI